MSTEENHARICPPRHQSSLFSISSVPILTLTLNLAQWEMYALLILQLLEHTVM